MSGAFCVSATDSPVSPVGQIPVSLRYVPSPTVCPWKDKNTVVKITFSSGNSLLVAYFIDT